VTAVLWHYPVLNLGGAELSTLRLLDGLVRRGLSPALVLNIPGGAAEGAVDPAIALHHLRASAAPRPRLPPRDLAGAARYAAARIGQHRAEARFARAPAFAAAAVGLQGLSPVFVCRKVRAARRLHFIRNDLSACDPTGRIARAIARTAPAIDAYVCVSEAARRSLLAVAPAVAAKAHTIHNLLAPERMRASAAGRSPYPPNGGRPRILTVTRLVESAKGLARMVRVHRALLGAGHDVDWFVVGDGPDRPLLERAVADAGTGARMHLTGRQQNPFPWYRHADVVAVPSLHEGLSGAINEAKALLRPVVATDVGGAREQLGAGGGLLVASDWRAIAEGLAAVLADRALRERLAATPLPAGLLDDEAKLDRLIALMTAAPAAARRPARRPASLPPAR